MNNSLKEGEELCSHRLIGQDIRFSILKCGIVLRWEYLFMERWGSQVVPVCLSRRRTWIQIPYAPLWMFSSFGQSSCLISIRWQGRSLQHPLFKSLRISVGQNLSLIRIRSQVQVLPQRLYGADAMVALLICNEVVFCSIQTRSTFFKNKFVW